jgi:hypothetical protein
MAKKIAQTLTILFFWSGLFGFTPSSPISLAKAQGTKDVAVTFDTGPVPVPLATAIRSLAQAYGYSAIVADIPDVKVVLRSLKLPLPQALELIVSTYLGKEFGYTLLPEKKVVVVAKKENLELALKGAGLVSPPQPPQPSEAKKEKESPSAPPDLYVTSLPALLDEAGLKESLANLGSEVKVSFVRSPSGTLLVAIGSAEALSRVRKLVSELIDKAPPPPPPADREEEAAVRLIALPAPLPNEALATLQGTYTVKLTSLGSHLLCQGKAEACQKVEDLVGKLVPPPKKEEKPTIPLRTWAFPVYGNPSEIKEAVEAAYGESIKAEGGVLYEAKDAKRLVVKASGPTLMEVYRLLEAVDPRPKPETKTEESLKALYIPRYKESSALISYLKGRFPDLKVEAKEGALLVEGAPDLTRQAIEEVKEQDRPKPQVTYRAIAFSANRDNALDFQNQLVLALRQGINLTLGPSFDFRGVLPPDPAISNSLQGVLKLAESRGWGKTVLDATIVATDGESNRLQSGGKVTVLNAVSTSQSSGGSSSGSGQNQQTQTTSQSQPLNYDFGLVLRVTPKVMPGGLVETALSLEINDEPSVSGQVVRYATKQTEGKYLVSLGQSIVIGGVISTSESESKTGIPLLMDIPILGNLFSSSGKTTSGNYLLIYLSLEQLSNPPVETGTVQYLPASSPSSSPSPSPLPERVPPPAEEGEGKTPPPPPLIPPTSATLPSSAGTYSTPSLGGVSRDPKELPEGVLRGKLTSAKEGVVFATKVAETKEILAKASLLVPEGGGTPLRVVELGSGLYGILGKVDPSKAYLILGANGTPLYRISFALEP